jgi:hypothetical protein
MKERGIWIEGGEEVALHVCTEVQELYAKPDVSVPCVIISLPSLLCIPVLIFLLLSLPFTEISNYRLE